MKTPARFSPLLLLLLSTIALGQQLKSSDLPTAKTTTVLPNAEPTEGLEIVGPAKAEVGELVHLEVEGLPPIDSSQSLDEALAWTKGLAMRVQQPPESEQVDFEVTLGFGLMPQLHWKLSLDLRADVAGDYAVVFAMPPEGESQPVQLATHGVRFGSGPIPPPNPDPMLGVFPGDPFSSRGPPGGPFSPDAKSYQLTNTGMGNLTWNGSVSSSWITVTPPMGVLGPGQTVEVLVGFAPEASSFSSGIYAAAATFENLTNGKGNTPRLVALTVSGNPPPPPISELWGIVIYETDDLDDYGPEMAQVLASTRIREISPKFYWRLFDEDVPSEEAIFWQNQVRENNLPLPHLFLVYEENGQSKLAENLPLPSEIDAVIATVRKYLKTGGR